MEIKNCGMSNRNLRGKPHQHVRPCETEFQFPKTGSRHNKKLLSKATPWREKQFIVADCWTASGSRRQEGPQVLIGFIWVDGRGRQFGAGAARWSAWGLP